MRWSLRSVLCACLGGCVAAIALPVHAAEPDDADDTPEVEATAPARIAAATTEDLYDLALLADKYPAFAELRVAADRRAWRRVVQLAGTLDGTADAQRDPVLRDAVVLLEAGARKATKEFAAAERAWKRLAQAGPLAQRARLELADLALKRGDVAEALVQLAAIAPSHPQRDRANLLMARLELQRGEVGPARDAVERVKPQALTKADRALWLTVRGEIAERSGQPAAAVAHFREAWELDTGGTEPGKRLAALDAAPSPADHIERILRRRSTDPRELRAWLQEAAAVTEDGSALRSYVQGSLAVRDKRTRDKALPLLEKALEVTDAPELRARILFALGDAQGKTGDERAAITTLERLDDLLKELAILPDLHARTLQRLHRLHTNVGQAHEAERVLVQLLDRHPDADERELAVWSLGWARFQAGDWSGALKHFVQLELEFGRLWTGAQQPWRAKAIYWQGRCLLQLGQVDQALDAWASLANTYAQTYYGILALDRMRELDRDRADALQGPPPSPSDAASTQLPRLDQLRVARSEALDEAAVLVRAGEWAAARSLLRDHASRGMPRDGIHLLAVLYEVEGRPRAAFGVMEKHTRSAARPDDATAKVWRQSFPKAFFEETAAGADAAGVARSFVYAIMRHESGFVPTARSGANAWGLLQLLPEVARNVAEVVGLQKPSARELLQPTVNTRMGAHYLAQIGSFVRGNHLLVAAAYNAGPYAVHGWAKKAAGQPSDVFVENIPYPATRAYVMQVAAAAQTYAFLYPEWRELERDRLGRGALVPASFGPFMQKAQEPARAASF
jgi:soluble lytic murein transglycosylase